jgi:hypothetical protein
MGSLIIKQVVYSGDRYFYESPELDKGINIIVGDNESGKSTFTYFIEFAFGGKIKPFSADDNGGKYREIVADRNNYILVRFLIDGKEYSIKRFIDGKEIFVQDGESTVSYPISRKVAPFIFSDWLLQKLGITVFQINLGATHWYFNFTDLFRLLNYDQNTEPRKIFKAPVAENFVAESVVVRKSIFEILLGMSSADYFEALDKLKIATRAKDDAKSLWDYFLQRSTAQLYDTASLEEKKKEQEEQLEKLLSSRDEYLSENTTVVDNKTAELATVQTNLIDAELAASLNRSKLSSLHGETIRVQALHNGLAQEISQIEKIIFTHDKLDLFSMELCPFCMNKPTSKAGHCICGSKFKDEDYEKFVYDSSEYKDILSHKQSSLKAITLAREGYEEEIIALRHSVENNESLIKQYREQLTKIIETAQFAGNNTIVDALNNKIIEVKDDLHLLNNSLRDSEEEKRLKTIYDTKKGEYDRANSVFFAKKKAFEENNLATVEKFNKVFAKLMSLSTYHSDNAEIDEDYMPRVENYRAKSSEVPKRLMYYFTILSLSLSLKSVKHPRFLLIDTPEDSGIDLDHLKTNLELLDTAISIAKDDVGELPDYQVILTTGVGKYPDSYEPFIKDRFSKADGNFILKPKK